MKQQIDWTLIGTGIFFISAAIGLVTDWVVFTSVALVSGTGLGFYFIFETLRSQK